MPIAHSTITLYNTNISQDKNMIVDSIATYLDDIVEKQVIDDFQFIKPSLVLTIKLNASQFDISPYDNYAFELNYVKIVNVDSAGATAKPLYYFIEDIKWISQSAIMLHLRLDVLNTFCSTWTESNVLDKQTRIKRATLKKYTKNTLYNKIQLNIPYLCDEINPIKYKKDNYVLDESSFPTGTKWYMIYKSRVSTEELENRPVDCFITSDSGLIKARVKANPQLSYSSMPNDYLWILGDENQNLLTNITFVDKDNETRTISFSPSPLTDVRQQAILIQRLTSPNRLRVGLYIWSYYSGMSVPYFRQLGASYETLGDSGAINLLNLYDVEKGRYNSTIDYNEINIKSWNAYTPTSSDVDLSLKPIQDLDRTDTSLVKIIELPYCPIELTPVAALTYETDKGFFDQSMSMIRLYDTTIKLERQVECIPSDSYNINSRLVTTLNTFQVTYPNKTLIESHWDDLDLEPMLKHSNYYSCKYIYDSFEKEVQLEEVNVDITYAYVSKFNFTFYATSTINSRFMFDVSDNGYTYKYSKEIYQDYMFIQRNNELTLYSDSFINYIRSGYNYDQKNRFYRNIQTGGNMAIGAIESFASGVKDKGILGSAVNTAIGVEKGVVSLMFENLQYLRDMEQKQVALKLQTETFSGADDLDLMDTYAGNKLRFMTFTPNEIMTKALHQLYFYTGYPQNYFDNALPHSNRYWFDFVQAEIIFKRGYVSQYSKEIQIEIVQKYSEGVTYFHRRNNEYDFEQKYVNHDYDLI